MLNVKDKHHKKKGAFWRPYDQIINVSYAAILNFSSFHPLAVERKVAFGVLVSSTWEISLRRALTSSSNFSRSSAGIVLNINRTRIRRSAGPGISLCPFSHRATCWLDCPITSPSSRWLLFIKLRKKRNSFGVITFRSVTICNPMTLCRPSISWMIYPPFFSSKPFTR